jgi:four helix bundle protein
MSGMSSTPRQDLVARSQRFSVRLLRFLQPLFVDPRMSRRFCENLAAAGTAIGHNISEAQSALSRRQMAQCYITALREAREARTALAVTRDIPKGDPVEVAWLHAEADEFVAILHVSVTKLREPSGAPNRAAPTR